jgi:hypothetical protein
MYFYTSSPLSYFKRLMYFLLVTILYKVCISLPGQDVVNEGLKCRHLNAKERKKEVNQSV